MRVGRDEDARSLLERALELAPGFMPARYQFAMLLHRRNECAEALAEVERLLAAEPRNPGYRNLAAVVFSRIGEYERASRLYAELVQEYPANSKVWLSYGHVLKTAGRSDETVAAYRRAIALEPSFGETYWSLANLKTFRFTAEDLAAMRARIADPSVSEPDRVHLHFALGKALEDAGDYAASFEQYALGNTLHRARHPYDAQQNTARLRHLNSVFTPEFFAARAGSGDPSDQPIFIVGMPRSGSTLLEQILSSHSTVEGTTELPELITMAKELRALSESGDIGSYADVLATLPRESLRELGARYLERTRVHRKTDRPRFIDKMPNNFLHVAMIRLALPNAKIIDARRHPMACCFSVWKQHFARGQNFSFDLTEVGRYYGDYVALMDHIDAVLPCRIERVIHEQLVEDPEAAIRRLLDRLGLPFDRACLEYYKNDRAVRTPSSEQVRRPISKEGVEQWRNYESWLAPLLTELEPVLDSWNGRDLSFAS